MPQQHKGERHAQTLRVPMEHYEVYAAEAARLGMIYQDYLVWKLAAVHGLQPSRWPRPQPPLLEDGDLNMAS